MLLLMIAHRQTHILARLEIGLRTDSSRLIELEKDLILALSRARGLGDEYGSPEDWSTAWSHHWDLVESIVRLMLQRVSEMHDAITNGGSDRFSVALLAWETLQIEDVRLQQTLAALHDQASGLNESAQAEWDALSFTLETHMHTIHACADALRIKLELLKKHSNEEVSLLVQKILARLSLHPRPSGMSAADRELEYQKATAELKQEQGQFLGFLDVVKALFMWAETNEERMDKNIASLAPTIAGRL